MVEKKIIYIDWREKIRKITFRVSNRRLNVATLTKYLLKTLAVSRGSVKSRSLSKILDRAILDNSFNGISFFIPSHVLFKAFRLFLK